MTRARRRKVSNPLGLAVLALLKERPMHPYQMASTLKERAKEESIKLNYGSLYSVIGALEREGFVEAGDTERAGARPERTVYSLTDAGRAELHDWMSDLLATPVKEYPKFEAALSLMPVLPPEEAVSLLNQRVQRLGRELAQRRAALRWCEEQAVERLFVIELEYELAMLEAERAWVMSLLELIRGSEDFTRTWRTFHGQAAETASPIREEKAGNPQEKD